jgi:hypothetical protein
MCALINRTRIYSGDKEEQRKQELMLKNKFNKNKSHMHATHEFVLQDHHPNLQISQADLNKLALADELPYGPHGGRGEDEAAWGQER